MIPDLALLPKKRFWSGKITYATILARVKIAKPSRMVLDPDYRLEPGWPSFLRERYVLRGVVDGLLLYQQTEQPAVEGNR
jgi:hypothetical protein